MFIIGTLAALLIIGAGFGGIVLAEGTTEDSQPDTLTARVARILGIDQQQLEDAFSQARTEMRNKNMERHLQHLIDEGIIAEEEAAGIREGSLPLLGTEIIRKGMKGRAGAEFDIDGFREKMKEWHESRPDIEEFRNPVQHQYDSDSGERTGAISGRFGRFRNSGGSCFFDELTFPSY